MADPISSNPIQPLQPAMPSARPRPLDQAGEGRDFASLVREQLEHVAKMQHEADQKVEQLLTGQTESLTEVFTAAQKAQVAFSLLMEIRNKLLDAYQELRNLRV